MNFKSIEKLSKIIENEKIIDKISSSIEKVDKEFTSNVIEASEKEIKPDDEDGKKILDFGNILRNFGYKILNLVKIELSISFAGVTLLHFVIPNVKDGQFVEKSSKSSIKNLKKM